MPDWTKRFDGQLAARAPLTDAQLADVPAKRGVFALLADRGAPIVLLTAANIRARLRSRLAEPLEDRRTRTVDLREITREVLWKRTGSHFETDLEYLEAVRRVWPKTYPRLLAWRRAWFVHVDPRAEYPHFVRTREAGLGETAGRYVGPFPGARDAGHFIDAIQDAFDLCREPRCLRQSPHGRRCSYAQIGRCLSPCDGTISMSDYRKVMAEAAAFAAGGRDGLGRNLADRMKAAAAGLRFEEAARIKARIDRLGEFDKPCHAWAAPLERFRFVLVQQGLTPAEAKVFLVSGGSIASAGRWDYPLRDGQVRRTLRRMASLAEKAPRPDEASCWRLGLVAHYLYCSEARRGVIVRWDPAVGVEDLRRSVEAGRGLLKLRAPRRRRGRPVGGKAPSRGG